MSGPCLWLIKKLGLSLFLFQAFISVLQASSPPATKTGPSQPQLIVLTISTPSKPGSANDRMLDFFIAELEKRAPKKFKIVKLLSHQAIPQGTELQAIEKDELDMALVSPTDLHEAIKRQVTTETFNGVERERFVAAALIQMLPFTFNDKDHIERTLHEHLNPIIYQACPALGIEILGNIYHGARVIEVMYDRSVTKPGDINDDELRMPEGEAWAKVGQVLTGGKRFHQIDHRFLDDPIDTGKVKVIDFPLSSFSHLKAQGQFKQILLTRHLFHWLYFVISEQKLKSLPETLQEAIKAAARKALEFNNQEREQEEVGLLENYKRKMIISQPNIAAFRKEVERVYGDILKEPFMKTLYDTVKGNIENKKIKA